MKTLVFCMTLIRNDLDRALLRIWLQLLETQNAGLDYDLLVVDSASPPEMLDLPGPWSHQVIPLGDDDRKMFTQGPRSLIRFQDRRGHPWHDKVTHASGSDRALMMGFQTAVNSGYDCVVYLEMDVLWARPLSDAISLMTKPAACLPLVEHGQFPETGLFIADCNHMTASDFIRRYDWRGPCWPEGERRQADIYGPDLQLLPFRGCRDEWRTRPDELAAKWPDGIDFLTHASPDTLATFLTMNGFADLAEHLAGVPNAKDR